MTYSETKPLLWLISLLLWFSPLWIWISPPLPRRLSSALLLSISYSCTLRLRRTPAPRLFLLSLPLLSCHVPLCLRCHPEEGAVTIAVMHGPAQSPGQRRRKRRHHHRHYCHHQPDEESQTWALSIPIRLADSHKLISYSLHSSIIHRPKEPWEAGGCKGPSPRVTPQLQHKGRSQHSVLSPYHQCPPSVSLRAGGSLSSCL